ncbi:sterol O-acyltransferase 2 isoform X2 [Candoia aspera]|uniref:sterol O-acyltransferase 2 isoform X2 n=1 Tax=Candoia aspera TaxID=51853 RepID=UPI002FD865D5
MDPKEMGTGGMRQRSSPKEARGKEEPQILNDGEHLDSITAHIQWKRQLEVMKAEVLGQVHNQLSDLLDTALEEAAHSFPQHLMVGPAKKQSREKGQPLQKKVFVRQVPLLDTLMEVEHFRTIYHVFVAILCICAINKIIVDSVNEGRLALDFQLLIFSFGQLPMTVFAWFCMFLYTLFVPYQALQIWSGSLKTARFPNLSTVTLVVLVVLCHTAVLGFFPVYVATHCNLGAASRCIVISEQVRFLMKTYSFLRESMPPLLHARVQDGKMRPPEFSAYLYFLFCPCLLYRESYPRDPYIRWSYVIQNLAKFLACIFYMNFILEYFTIPLFNNMHKQPFHINSLVLSILHTTVPGIVLLLLGFYLFMQCWSNCFAEMLRFADRGFYKDWWNSTSFSAYYRFWNVIVHDWLYCYIYQDFLWCSLTLFSMITEEALSGTSSCGHPSVWVKGSKYAYIARSIMHRSTVHSRRRPSGGW